MSDPSAYQGSEAPRYPSTSLGGRRLLPKPPGSDATGAYQAEALYVIPMMLGVQGLPN